MAFLAQRKYLVDDLEKAIRDAVLALRGYRSRAYHFEVSKFVAWAIARHNWGIVNCYSCSLPMWGKLNLKRWKNICSSCRNMAKKAGIDLSK